MPRAVRAMLAASHETLRSEAEAAAYSLTRPPSWVSRHVETYSFERLAVARRHLTVDLILPVDDEAIISRAGSDADYILPLTRMPKDEPVPFLDLRDERGEVLPLRTRTENAELTRDALRHAIRTGAGPDAQLPEELDDALRTLVFWERPAADYGAVLLERALNDLPSFDAAVRARLDQVITHLIINSIIWLPLRGVPGARRVLKLSAAINIELPPFPARVREAGLVTYGDVDIPNPRDGRVAVRESLRVLRAVAAARAGWDSIDIGIRDPAIQDPRSYHLQVEPPAGVRVDRIEFDPDRRAHLDEFPDEVRSRFAAGEDSPKGLPYARGPHLYLHEVEFPFTRAIPLVVSLRVARRGFLNLCLLAAIVIAAMLWFYERASDPIEKSPDHGAVAGAVLILLPSFLALFAGRSSENMLSSTLLSGIRFATMVSALAAGLAAAAIGGVRPADSLSSSLTIYAAIATVCCAGIGIAWLASFRWIRQRARRGRRWWCGPDERRRWSFLAVAVLAGVLALAGWQLRIPSVSHPSQAEAVILSVALLLCVSAAWPTGASVPNGARVLTGLSLFAAGALSVTLAGPGHMQIGRAHLWLAAVALAGLAAAWALATGFALQLAPVGFSPEDLAPEPAEAADLAGAPSTA